MQNTATSTWLLRCLHNHGPLFDHHKMPSAEIFHFEKNINNQTGLRALLAAPRCCWTAPRETLLCWRLLSYPIGSAHHQLPCGGNAVHEVGRELDLQLPEFSSSSGGRLLPLSNTTTTPAHHTAKGTFSIFFSRHRHTHLENTQPPPLSS